MMKNDPSLSKSSKAGPFLLKLTGASPEIAANPGPPPHVICCMVTHGMGQQVPFETVSLIAEAFVRGRNPSSIHANRVRLTQDGSLISRMELVYPGNAGQADTHLHIYEGYWAPLTEGKIGFLATLLFLLSGLCSGLKTCCNAALHKVNPKRLPGFSRWMFGGLQSLPVKAGTAFQLLLTGLVLLIAIILGVLCVHVLKHEYIRLAQINLQLFDKLWVHRILAALSQPFASGAAFGKFVARVATLLVSAIYAYVIRYFVIEYVGDVAIYVSSYKVSEYEVIRKTIQQTVFDLGSQIFQARASGEARLLYERIAFVGHSLGSVITYDLLNDLIVWDRDGNSGKYGVLERTTDLITFGSPLDKTAFLFRAQIDPEHLFRERLAALEQPMIMDYSLRPFSWRNIYSHFDIISAALKYYDLPVGSELPPQAKVVINQIDPQARRPLLAHEQYWTGKTLSNILQAFLRVT